jgi:hypothetical protein
MICLLLQSRTVVDELLEIVPTAERKSADHATADAIGRDHYIVSAAQVAKDAILPRSLVTSCHFRHR